MKGRIKRGKGKWRQRKKGYREEKISEWIIEKKTKWKDKGKEEIDEERKNGGSESVDKGKKKKRKTKEKLQKRGRIKRGKERIYLDLLLLSIHPMSSPSIAATPSIEPITPPSPPHLLHTPSSINPILNPQHHTLIQTHLPSTLILPPHPYTPTHILVNPFLISTSFLIPIPFILFKPFPHKFSFSYRYVSSWILSFCWPHAYQPHHTPFKSLTHQALSSHLIFTL